MIWNYLFPAKFKNNKLNGFLAKIYILTLFIAFFIGVVAIWFTIDKQMIGNNLSHVGDGAAFQNMDIFVPSPGEEWSVS